MRLGRQVAVWFALLCSSLWGARQFPFRHYHRGDGLVKDSVRCLLQDRDGFLWIGTSENLYRYDGQRFQSFGPETGLPGSRVRSLHETADGTLWAGTSGGLAYRKGDRFEAADLPSAFSISQDRAIVSHHETLYVAGSAGLLVGSVSPKGSFRLMQVPPDAGGAAAQSLHLDPDGTVWVACGTTLCRLGSRGLETFGPAANLPKAEWQAVRRDRDGVLWVRSHREIWLLEKGKTGFRRFTEPLPLAGAVPSLYLDPSGRLVIPTRVGVRFLSGWPAPWLKEEHGLPAEPVSNVLWDREGNLWLGLEFDGLARLKGQGRWTSWTKQEGLSSSIVSAIQRDPAGRLWVGTHHGLNMLAPGTGTWRSWTRENGLPNDEIRSLVADSQGGLWIGSGSGGFARMDTRTGVVQPFGVAQGIGNQSIVTLDLDGETLWVLTRGGVFRGQVRPPWRFELITFPAVGRDRQVYRILRAHDGVLWAAGRQGLMRREGGAWRLFGTESGLLHRSLAFLAEGADHSIWVGYGDVRGVSRMDWRGGAPSVTHYGESSVLGSNDISFLGADRRGYVWIGTENGVDLFDGRDWRRFTPDHGLLWPDCVYNSFWIDREGDVYIGTNRGVSAFHAPDRFELPASPTVFITSFNSSRSVWSEPAVRWRDQPIRLQFAAPSFVNERDIRFRYRLANSGDWTETERGEAIFERLDPGGYTFEVGARHAPGPWTEMTVRHDFRILPSWWQAWWFRTVCFLALLAAVMGLWKLRLRRHLTRQVELEHAVAARTREIEFQKQEIEMLLDAAQESNRLKNEFLANVSHEIRTPMNAVIGLTQLALTTPLTSEQRDYLETADSSARSLLHLLNELLDFSRIEQGRMPIERIPFSLEDVVGSAASTLGAVIQGAEIELRTGISPEVPATLAGDPVRLRQVLLNLLSNAIKFTRKGWVHVRAERIRVDSCDWLRISVQDTGIGVPKEKQEVIFEPFRQADGSTTRLYGGTGLGLAISKRIVEAMGGRIGVESEPGSGSTFWIEVPMEAHSLGAPEEVSSPTRGLAGSATPTGAIVTPSEATIDPLLAGLDEPQPRAPASGRSGLV
ncbi:MAG: two-component regulator propeller domain-containing protein [Bryobacteraceae bacterium]